MVNQVAGRQLLLCIQQLRGACEVWLVYLRDLLKLESHILPFLIQTRVYCNQHIVRLYLMPESEGTA